MKILCVCRYDTRSEVASSVTSDSDSGDGVSTKSFDIKRKRTSNRVLSHAAGEVNRKNDSVSPLKKNSMEYINKLNYLFRDARFFIIKSSNSENIALSKAKGVWATLPQNQIKLSEAFRSSENVILIFSAKESGKFSGFARLATGVDRSISPVHWVVPAELTPNLLKGTFRIDWICRKDLPFSFTTTLYNPWNCNKPVKIARDGQEVEPRVGEKLCRLFPEDDGVDITPILRKSKEATKNRIGKHFADMPGKGGLYTAKYRAKMLQHQKNPKDRMTFPHRMPEDGRILKHYKSKAMKNFPDPKDGSLRNRMISSMENYVKRFGRSFRPPLPVSLPFLPHPLPPGAEMFPSQFGHMPFPQPPPLPRYYDPVPTFPHFPKMGPLPPPKTVYDRTVEDFLRRNREKDYYSKKNDRIKRKDNDNKDRRNHFRERH